MMFKLRVWSALPTWLMVRMCQPFFSNSHPWKGQYISLYSWYRGRTSYTVFTDLLFWVYFFIGITAYVLYKLL